VSDDDEIPNGVWQIDGDTRMVLRLERARAAFAQGNALGATVEAEELLDEDPDQADALEIVAESAIELNHAEVAASAFEDCIRLGLATSTVMAGLAVARFDLCDLEGAIESAREAIRLDARSARGHHFLAMALARTPGGAAESAEHLATAHRIDPERFPAPLRLTGSQWEKALTRAFQRVDADVAAFWLDIRVLWEDLPDLDELRSHDPPIRPTVGGLYLGELPIDGDPRDLRPEALRLYRKNLANAADREELVETLAMVLEDEAHSWLGTTEDVAPQLPAAEE
jgi:tetratricopeptide (TPR) repeat protein